MLLLDSPARNGDDVTKLIAVIDDDPDMLSLMRELLREAQGYSVLLLQREDTAYGRIQGALPDAIILDLRLEHPEGGWHILENIRLDPALANIPVIVCSGDLRVIQERAADLRRHKAEVLPKPFDLHDLLSMLNRLIGPGDGP